MIENEKKAKKFLVYATATVSKYVGAVFAEDKNDALGKALDVGLDGNMGHFCSHCDRSVGERGAVELQVEEVK